MQRSLVKRNYRNIAKFAVGVSMSGLLAIAPLSPSLAISPEEVPNPRQIDGTWIADTADLLSSESEALLNQQISELEAQSGHEIAIVTVTDTVPSPSPKAFATELFNTWGIGKATADNGLLFLISQGERRTEIEIGYGLESVLTDAQAGQILREDVTPLFRFGDYEGGIVQGTETIISVLSGEASPPTVVLPSEENAREGKAGNWAKVILLLGGLFGFSALCYWADASSGGRDRDDRYRDDDHYSASSYSSNDYSSSSSDYSSSSSDFGGGSSGGGGAGDSW